MAAAEAWDAALPLAQTWVMGSVAAWPLPMLLQWGWLWAWPSPSEKPILPIANLFRCYFAILITGAEAVLVADAARPCVLQPQGDRVGPSQRRYLAARRHRTGWKK
jgi:hypothetical protein